MRFSIASIILLTFWIALGLQVHRGTLRYQETLAERAKTKARIKVLRSEIALWKQQEVQQTVQQRVSELKAFQKLNESLTDAFQQEAAELSVLQPSGSDVSIRTMPLLDRSQEHRHQIKLFVPESRRLAIKVGLYEDGGRASQPIPPEFGVEKLKGEYPVIVELEPGIRLVECLFRYRGDEAKPFFVTRIDEEEVCRLTCLTDINGYSSSHTNWYQPRIVHPDARPNELLGISPSDMDLRIRVSLIDMESQSSKETAASDE